MTPIQWKEAPSQGGAEHETANPPSGYMAILSNPAFSMFLAGLVAGFAIGKVL